MTESNCPNCGAPKTGPSCPYCGTRFGGLFINDVRIDNAVVHSDIASKMVARGILSVNEAMKVRRG